MTLRIRIHAALWIAACAAGGASAAEAGAPTVASAPMIPVGQQQVHAVAGIDYWRVKLRARDRLVLEYGPQKRGGWVELCVYRPGVTDDTLEQAKCYAGTQSLADDMLRLTARPAGVWIIAVRPYPGCSSEGITSPRCTNTGLEYKLTVRVQRETRVTLAATNLARAGQPLRVRGTLKGAKGRVLVETSLDGGAWTTAGIYRVVVGKFSATLRPRTPGILRVRVTFPESHQYAESSAIAAIRIV